MNNFARSINGPMVQATAIALVVACGSLSMQGAAVRLPEDESAMNSLLLPSIEIITPAGVEGEANGMSTPVTEALEETSAPRVFLRRSVLPGSARVSVNVFALQKRNDETVVPQPLSVARNSGELWFGPSENCRRFAMVCRLGGLP
jgi:hypothetical protein